MNPVDLRDDDVRVLVVDDLVDAADLLAGLLELDGYTVKTAHDGREALRLVESWCPVCVILDIDMPGINGLELSNRLRELHKDNIVLIAVTGWDKSDPRVEGTFEVVDHYLGKPVDPKILRMLLPPVRP